MSDSINSNNKKNYDKYSIATSADFTPGRTESAKYPKGQLSYAHRGLVPQVVDFSKMSADDRAAYEKNNQTPTNSEVY